MTNRADEVLSLDVPCDRHAPGVVRAALSRIESLGWILGDIMLVASELVTNAVRHSGCLRQDVLKVRASLSPDRVTISVHDPGLSSQSARPRPVEGAEGDGWGLHVIELLAARWGAMRDGGYRVWAEVALMP